MGAIVNGEWVIIIRYGEIGIKGEATRSRMERLLVRNIREALNEVSTSGKLKITRVPGRIYVRGFENEDEMNKYIDPLTRVMGIVSLSPAYMFKFYDLNDLVEKAYSYFKDRLKGSKFAVKTRRTGRHGFTSMDISRLLGGLIVERNGLKVDLENPDYTCYVEIRDVYAYVYDKVIKGPGGLPIGCEGRVLALFSGGIDSPVASWFMMRRGCYVDLVLFNIGGEEQVEMVKNIAYVLMSKWGYGYNPKLYIIDLRPLIPRIVKNTPMEYIVIILRRLMMRTASRLAELIGAKGLVTGENLGQVASQTLDNLYVINQASKTMVLRPLIGFDKEDTVKYAKYIGTYEYSSKMKEYCLIGARRVATRSILDDVLKYEESIGIKDDDIDKLLANMEIVDIKTLRNNRVENSRFTEITL